MTTLFKGDPQGDPPAREFAPLSMFRDIVPDAEAWTPEAVLDEAHRRYGPFIRTYCLFSGGNDSAVVAHRMRDHFDALVFIDTGTAVPGVRDFVTEYAEWLGKSLVVYESGDEYRRMVLGIGRQQAIGFPGPAMHGRCFNRLKERQIESLLRDAKVGAKRSDRVLLITGVRRAESQRRARREPVTKKGAAVYVNPLIDWRNADMHAYRAHHDLPESDVAALLHRSGECNCGAFARPGEREELRSLYPAWFAGFIAPLEQEAREAGLTHCVWGQRTSEPTPSDAGALCSDCQLRFDATVMGAL